MGWEKVYTITATVDEPAEGAELDWEEETLHGEQLVAAYDDVWPACPRARLREEAVDSSSLKVVVAASRLELAVSDYTNDATIPIPPPGDAYLRRHEGPSYNETYLYVNPAYDGLTLCADYHYYPAGGEVQAFMATDDYLYFAIAAGGKWKAWDGEIVSAEGVIKPGEDGLTSALKDLAGDVWALTNPSGILARRGRYWSGYLEIEGIGIPGRAYLGELAQAAATAVALKVTGRLVFGAPACTTFLEIPPEGILAIKTTATTTGKCAVELVYRGGRVRSGTSTQTYRFDNTLITSRAHAQILCDDLAARIDAGGESLTVAVMESYYSPPGTLVRLAAPENNRAVYRVSGTRRDLANGLVELRLAALLAVAGEEATS